MRERIRVGISMGDYNGIGPEVIIRVLEDERLFKLADFVIYGNKQVLHYYTKLLKVPNFQVQEVTDTAALHNKIPNVLNCWEEAVTIEPGKATSDAGKRALLCLNKAADDLVAGNIEVLVTAPINKQTVSEHYNGFKGQTEYIATKAGSEQAMMLLVDDHFRVGLVSNHISLKEVPQKIDMPLIISKLELLARTLRQDFLIERPKIAVLGLNPHSGDNGLLGKEEKEIIAPAVTKARDKGIMAMGPFPADGFFGTGNYRQFDAVLAMYHDQGLIPFKTLAFSSGVNYTAGLNVIRTSPDHGTGYDIAGQDKADCGSLRSAIFSALDIYRNRADYAEMSANPVERVRLHNERED
ncbi:MAG: 4-hydroxythreonine-4-phosphate dehydrogenase PdxA [Chitinophagales bacterium]